MATTTQTRTDPEIDRAPRDVDEDVDSDAARDSRAERYDTRSDEGAGARAASSLASVTRGLASLVRLAAGVIAAIIALGVLFIVLEANASNTIVSTVHDVAKALVGPFDGMFDLDNAKAEVAVNWGIAAFVYLILGALVAWLIVWIGTAGLRLRRT